MRIAVDCDGVLANFQVAYAGAANHIWPNRLDPRYVPTHWNDFQGLSKEEDVQVWERIKATPNFWTTLPAYAENVAALASFLNVERGHDIYIVTSRTVTVGASIAFQTDMWLRMCGIYNGGGSNYLAVLPVDSWHDKRKLYKAAQFDFSLDDKKETVEDCDGLPEHQAFLLDRGWNQDAKVKRRVSTVAEFFDAVRWTIHR